MARNDSKSNRLRRRNGIAPSLPPAQSGQPSFARGKSAAAFFSRSRVVSAALALLVSIVFGQLAGYDFVNYDDIRHVYGNEFVHTGLSWRNFVWSLQLVGPSQWHPLTWLSHQLDCQLYGLNPCGHHLTSVGFHLLSTLLLFLVLRRMTKAFWPSALVAALFGVHPLNVESVAWIAERKDVLSTLFWMLTMLAYVSYARHRPEWKRYLLVFTMLALGLMAKPMLITLPCVLLLCDLWPLRRISEFRAEIPGEPADSRFFVRSLGWLMLEKIPLLGLSIASVVLTILRQPVTHGLGSGHAEPTTQLLRTTNGLIIYVLYLRRMVWPSGLAISYDLPRASQITATYLPAAVAGAMVLLATCVAVWQMKKRPWLATGWFWYLGVLVPVVGVLPFGMQTMADRYTYVPAIGIFAASVWGANDLLRTLSKRGHWAAHPAVVWGISLCTVCVFAGLAHRQTGYWQDSISLFTRALDVRGDDHLAHNNLGTALHDRRRTPEAETHLRKAVAMNPQHISARYNLAHVLEDQNKLPEAERHYRKALEIDPDHAESHNNLGNLLHQRGATEEAISHFREALRVGRDAASTHYNLGIALDDIGRSAEAVSEFRQAAALNPDDAEIQNNLGKALYRSGQKSSAAAAYRRAIELQPDYSLAHSNLASVLIEQGEIGMGIRHYRRALERPFPNWAMAASNLACVLATAQDPRFRHGADAVRFAEAASLRLGHGHPRTLDILATAYAELGRYSEAVQTSQRALQIATANQEQAMAQAIQYRLQLFAQGRPFRQTFSPNGN